MSLTLYFLRHGQTAYSHANSYCGDIDPDLTPAGVEMAEAFARAYRDLPWQAVYCSPKHRAIATAAPLCAAIGQTIQLREGLKEIGYGQWEGLSPAEVNERFHDDYIRWLADPGWNAPTGGETGVYIARRASQVLDEIERTHSKGNVLIVSHKATIRIMLCALLGIDIGRFRDRIGMPVASVSVVEMAERGPLLKVMGDRAHLGADLRNLEGS